MAKFITGKELTDEVSEIIFQAKKQLLIVSPYIKLDEYFKDALFKKHKTNSELHLIIAFGKNEKNIQKSLKKVDLDYFKDFPNVSIIYVPNLHAKYYANEKKGVITSINLYDYSFKENVEFGVVSETTLFGGTGIDKEAWDQTMTVLKDNYTIFIRRPNFKKKTFGRDYIGSETHLDITENLLNSKLIEKCSVFDFMTETYVNIESNQTRISREEFEKETKIDQPKIELSVANNKNVGKLISATNLGKIKGKSFDEVITKMTSKNYILDKNTIAAEGEKMGIKYNEGKNGNKWIVYPESLAEIL